MSIDIIFVLETKFQGHETKICIEQPNSITAKPNSIDIIHPFLHKFHHENLFTSVSCPLTEYLFWVFSKTINVLRTENSKEVLCGGTPEFVLVRYDCDELAILRAKANGARALAMAKQILATRANQRVK